MFHFFCRSLADVLQYLCIIGDSPALGSWDPQKGLRMKKRKVNYSVFDWSVAHPTFALSLCRVPNLVLAHRVRMAATRHQCL